MQESRIDDSGNIDGSRDLSGSWTSFTELILLEEKPPEGYMWFREEILDALEVYPRRLDAKEVLYFL